jgi:hypothetical protein
MKSSKPNWFVTALSSYDLMILVVIVMVNVGSVFMASTLLYERAVWAETIQMLHRPSLIFELASVIVFTITASVSCYRLISLLQRGDYE